MRRYRDGERRLPEGPTRIPAAAAHAHGKRAGGAGLAFLMDGRADDASEWLHRAAERYRESMAEAPPGSWGRPIGAMKALVLADDWAGAEDAARWALELGAAEAESPIGRYAGSLALLILGRDSRRRDPRRTIRTTRSSRTTSPTRWHASPRSDVPGYTSRSRSVLESFETREEYLEDIAVADTVLVLQALAARRGSPPSSAPRFSPSSSSAGA